MNLAQKLAEAEGLISEVEARALAGLASAVSPAVPVIVEIGSYTGKSASNIAAAAPFANVYCIDLWDMLTTGETLRRRTRKKYRYDFNSADAHQTFLKRTAQFKNVIWIKGDSGEIAKAWSRPIGMLFIDGAHDLKSVTSDYRSWSPHVANGGWIAFHDSNGKGVRAVIEEAKNSGRWGDWRTVERLTVARRYTGEKVFPLE